MKTITRILADFARILISGSTFPRNRDFSDDWDNSELRPQKKKIKDDVERIIPVVNEHLEFHPPTITQTGH